MVIADVIAELGVVPRDGEDVVLTVIRNGGTPENFTLDECAAWPLEQDGNVYLASGLFRHGSVRRKEGRKGANVARVLWLPFDADLKDYLDVPAAEVLALDEAEVPPLIERQRVDLEEAFGRLGLPVHRLDFTGHGLCAYVYLDDAAGLAVDRVPDVHKAIIKRVNDLVGFRLVDPEVSDAGSRITRLPGTLNRKAHDAGLGPARQTKTLSFTPGMASAVLLGQIARGEAQAPPPTRVIPDHGKRLDDDAVGRIVSAVAPHWTLGQKHAVSLALSGMLAKAGVPEEQALAIVERLSAGDAKPWDRARSVRDSYNRVRSGLDIKGFYGLRDYLPAEAIEYVDGVLKPLREATSTHRLVYDPSEIRDAKIEELFTAPGSDVYYGWFREYAELMAPTSEAPDQYHLASGLVMTGALIGRRVAMEWFSESLYTNLYAVLIGRTGRSRKDTAIKRALQVTQRPQNERIVNPTFDIARDVSSAEGLIQVLQKKPNTLIYLTELTAMLRNARRKGTSTILDRLIEAWDTPEILQNLSKLAPVQAAKPYLSILAATQPSRLADNMTDEDIQSGFANRWLYVVGKGKEPMSRAPSLDWKAAWSLYLRLFDAITSYPEGTVLCLSDEAGLAWDAWYSRMLAEEGRDESEDDMRARHPNLAMKVALIYAISDRARAIEARHLEAALALVDWMWRNVRELMRVWGVGVDGQIAERILTLLKKGPMKRRELQMYTRGRKWGPREFAAVFEAMQRNGTIEADAAGVFALAR
jgi:hypothetical protein